MKSLNLIRSLLSRRYQAYHLDHFSSNGLFGSNCVRNYSFGRCRRDILISRSKGSFLYFSTSSSTFEHVKQAPSAYSNDPIIVPDPPSALSPTESAAVLQQLTENNLHALGLGSYYTPVGWIQNLLGNLHLATGLPWWEVIVLATLLIRTCTLPIIISSQRRSAVMLEYFPEFEALGRRAEEAKKSGDQFQLRLALLEMNSFLREKHLPAMGRMLAPMLANGAIFTSYFLALRSMASKSVAGMQSEGLLWFTNLAVPDPLVILPTMCALSTLLVIEVGIEFGVGAKQMQPSMRWLMRIMPFSVLLVSNHIPAAVMCYWFTSNIISLFLSVLFRSAAVRRFLKIPPMPKRESSMSIRESWRLPQFLRDYLSAPVLLFRAASSKLRKSGSKAPTRTGEGKGH